MRTVWKFQIAYLRSTVGTFEIPEGAHLVHVAGDPAGKWASLWFEVDPARPRVSRTFEVFGTGHPVPDAAGVHVGTVIAAPLVLHVYERAARVAE